MTSVDKSETNSTLGKMDENSQKQIHSNSEHSEHTNDSDHSDHSDHSSGHSYFLQQNNIYWETGHRTYIPFFHPLIRKYTTKIIDDQIRNYCNEVKSVNSIPFVFYKDGFFRNYYADRDVNMIQDLKKNTNFVFNSTGTIRHDDTLQRSPIYEKSSYIFDQIIMSAYKMDLSKMLVQSVNQMQHK